MNIDIGMSGNRGGMSENAKSTIYNIINTDFNGKIHNVRHGDCVGSDCDFHKICSGLGLNVIIHPPNVNSMRAFCKSDTILEPKPFLIRNKDIVNSSNILVAFPDSKEELLRSGTWSTIRYARKMNKKIIIIYPDGSVNDY